MGNHCYWDSPEYRAEVAQTENRLKELHIEFQELNDRFLKTTMGELNSLTIEEYWLFKDCQKERRLSTSFHYDNLGVGENFVKEHELAIKNLKKFFEILKSKVH